MHTKGKKFVAILFAILLVSLTAGAVNAQTPIGERYFYQTGHTVRDGFLDLFENAPEPLLLFGYPITDEFVDTLTNNRTQYFNKARFDLELENGAPRVSIAPLGKLLYDDLPQPVDLPTNGPLCRSFPSGYSVCYAFLQFYDTYQGEKYFGDPIGPLESRDGRLVQYFENARMEWWPEFATGERVVLTDLGRIYFDLIRPNIENYSPIPLDRGNIAEQPTKVQANAFVEHALAQIGATQTVYVIVQDQDYQPVHGATVTLRVSLPDGTENVYPAQLSDINGISSFAFEVGKAPRNQVARVQAQITYQGTQTKALTWFRVWW